MKLTRLLVSFALFISAAGTTAARVPDDPTAEQLFQREAQVLRSLKSVRADVTETFYTQMPNGTVRPSTDIYHVRALRPNFMRIDDWYGKTFAFTDDSDGKTDYFYQPGGYTVKTNKPGASGQHAGVIFIRTLWGFFHTSLDPTAELANQKRRGLLLSLRAIGSITWQGQVYQAVEWHYISSFQAPGTPHNHPQMEMKRLYFGADGLLHRIIEHSTVGYTIDTQMPTVTLNPPLTPASFAYTPPAPPISVRVMRGIAQLLSHF